jgi:CheY-like chemotaxis protein
VKQHCVLLVDDDAGTLTVLGRSLTELLTAKVMLAANGEEAVDILRTTAVDVVVTDLAMPVMDGFGLIAYLHNRHASLPVIVLTGLPEDEVSRRLAGYHGLRILHKPVASTGLARVVREVLDQAQLGSVEGVPLSAIAQLIELERRSCTVSVRSGARTGRLHFREGRICDAWCADAPSAEVAAREVLTWNETQLEFERLAPAISDRITMPLQRLLLDAAETPEQRYEEDDVVDGGEPAESGAGHLLLETVRRLRARLRAAEHELASMADDLAEVHEAAQRVAAAELRQAADRANIEALKQDVRRLAHAIVDRVDGLFAERPREPDGPTPDAQHGDAALVELHAVAPERALVHRDTPPV